MASGYLAPLQIWAKCRIYAFCRHSGHSFGKEEAKYSPALSCLLETVRFIAFFFFEQFLLWLSILRGRKEKSLKRWKEWYYTHHPCATLPYHLPQRGHVAGDVVPVLELQIWHQRSTCHSFEASLFRLRKANSISNLSWYLFLLIQLFSFFPLESKRGH